MKVRRTLFLIGLLVLEIFAVNSCYGRTADSLKVMSSHFRAQFVSGWSTDYTMGKYSNSYPKDGLAWATTSGVDCGFAMGRFLIFYGGLRYNSCMMWDTDVDSSLYSSTGLVLYKDCKYSRSNLGMRIGLGGVTKAGKIFVSPEVAVTRRFFENIRVEDHINQSRGSLDVKGASRGSIFSGALNIGYRLNNSVAIWAGYSFLWSTERIKIPPPYTASSGYSFALSGKFHSVNAAITYTFH